MIRASYDLLGYISFFTVGEDECRAWSIPRGTPAQLAAGEIHSDIARGFIRAEVVGYDALIARGSMAACREHGEVRLEGKEYVVQDGDIINFRFATLDDGRRDHTGRVADRAAATSIVIPAFNEADADRAARRRAPGRRAVARDPRRRRRVDRRHRRARGRRPARA